MDNSENLIINNLSFYDILNPKKPENSYTVLSTINDHKTGELLALATGTQANLRTHRDDIEDSHAESLVKRAYKRYLIAKIDEIINRSSDTNENLRKKVVRECQQDLTFFVSQFPCGLTKRYKGKEPLNEETGEIIMRKPGRGTEIDGKIVYVEKNTCCLKLKNWAENGLQGRELKNKLGIENKIKKIIIGNCEPEHSDDTTVSPGQLMGKLKNDFFACSTEKGIKFTVEDFTLLENLRREDLIFTPNKQPQPVATVWWSSTNVSGIKSASKRTGIGEYELVVDGRKKGVTKRQRDLLYAPYKLKISDHSIERDLSELISKFE